MATAIKVDDATKTQLDRLQARLTLALGRRPALQELVAVLARLGGADEDRLARELGSDWRPLTEEEVERVLGLLPMWDQVEPTEPEMGEEDRDIYEET